MGPNGKHTMETDGHGKERSESDLISALRAGDPTALSTLHSRYLTRVFGYVVRRTDVLEDAEDITCEVFAAALTSLSGFRAEASLFAWLIGIARRKIADHLRRSKRRREVIEADLICADRTVFEEVEWTEILPDEFIEREDVIREVRVAIRQLPAAQREVLMLKRVEGMSIREISLIVQRSEDSVKAQLRRAHARLLSLLSGRRKGPASRNTFPHRGEHHEESSSAF